MLKKNSLSPVAAGVLTLCFSFSAQTQARELPLPSFPASFEVAEYQGQKGCIPDATKFKFAGMEKDSLVKAILQKPGSRAELNLGIAKAANAGASQRSKPTKRRMRVLSAEDNKTNRLVLEKLLKSLNIDLEFAHDGVEAVEKFKSYAPDLIFMDISMPRMDGTEATQKIRELEEATKGHVPIIALTALANDGDEEHILSHGLDRYLTKPLRKKEIFKVIAEVYTGETVDPFPEPEELPLQASG